MCVYQGLEALIASIQVKNNQWGPQTFNKYILSLEKISPSFLIVEFLPLEALARFKKLGHSFKEALTPFGFSFIFPNHQVKVDEPLFQSQIFA